MAYSLENTQDLTDLADAIRVKAGVSGSMTVPQMTDAVESISSGLTPRSVGIINNLQATLFTRFPEIISATTNFRLSGYNDANLFQKVDNTDMTTFPPIVIANGAHVNANYMFYYNSNLQNISINIEQGATFYIENMSMMFQECLALKSFDFSFMQYATPSTTNLYMQCMFQECNRLRNVSGLEYLQLPNVQFSNNTPSVYRYGFYDCLCLDKIENMPVIPFGWTNAAQAFDSFVYNCAHLSKLTFKTNNGVPQTANWQRQRIDLSGSIGYVRSTYYKSTLQAALGADKEVSDAASYNALKNDPNWWTADVNYSRYNHDSAVETINSLPDCSAQANTNYIKFNGASGTYTDGGPISALTAAEIQVATDKNWTVEIV